MSKITFNLEKILDAHPNQRAEILPSLHKANQYSTDCGCAMGARFLGASFLFFAISFVSAHNFEFVNILKQIGLGLLLIFAASIAGKLVGIGIAKIRLRLLYRQLAARYPISEE